MSPTTRRRTQKDYWILDREQIQCLTASRRQDMLDRLAAEGPLSVRELAESLRVKPSTLYHHLKLLLQVNLVIEAGVRVVNRKQEKLYTTPSPRMRLRRALGRPEFRDLMRETVSALSRQMDRDFAEGLESPDVRTQGKNRNLGFFRLLAAPKPATLARINHHLDEIAELLWDPGDPKAPLIAFSWTLAPVSPAKPESKTPPRKPS